MSYIGNPIVSTDFPVDYFSGNGSTTAFTLSIAPASVNAIDVQVSGVSQSPQTYTVSGTTLTFSAAPPTGSSNIVVRHLGIAGIPNTPSAASVSYSSLDSSLQNRFDNSNKIINGCMRIDQRNAGASKSYAANSAAAYSLDRWNGENKTDGTFTIQQSSSAPSGFSNSLVLTVTGTDTSLGATQYAILSQAVEGFNSADLNWGTANAKAITLTFQVYCSVTGTFGGVLTNSAQNRSYPFSYSIASANTWTTISISVAGDTSGTWLTNNGAGLYIMFGFGVGSTYSGTAGSWAGATYLSATGATNLMATNGATFYITGVDLRKGSYSTAPTFDMRQYGQELALCERYYYRENVFQQGSVGFFNSYYGGSNAVRPSSTIARSMRTAPTLSFINNSAIEYYSYAGSWTVTSLAGSVFSPNSVYIYTASDGDGRGKLMQNSNGIAPVMVLTAEL